MNFMHDEVTRLRDGYGWNPKFKYSANNLCVDPDYVVPDGAFSEEQSAFLGQGQEGGSWWFETRNLAISRAILEHGNGECIWEVGCGSGAVGSNLVKNGHQCIGIEPSFFAAQLAAAQGLFSIQSDLETLRFPANSLGQIGLFDVLEHVRFRQEFLEELGRVLKPCGRLFITVPAMKILWSQADVVNGHFLRYSRHSIIRELEDAGFQVLSVRYLFFTLLFPLLVLRAIPHRLGIELSRTDRRLLVLKGGFMGLILRKIELLLHRSIPFGTSLMVVATKRV
jgi:SAM-dependent methyltransferase